MERVCYNINKNLEKQLIKFFRILCMNGNRKMQNFLRKQHTNVKSFNIISIISENASDYIPKLKFAIPFDLFVESILAMTEFIQGSNTDNQQILMDNELVEMAARILEMDYATEHKDRRYEQLRQLYQTQTKPSEGATGGLAGSSNAMGTSQNLSLNRSSLRQTQDRRSGEDQSDFTVDHPPQTNYQLSILKYRTLRLLLQMLDGHSPQAPIYYQVRRIVSAEILRKNLAYQTYFFRYYHRSQLSTDLFFKYDKKFSKKGRDPFIIEIGFNLFFLLREMEEHLKFELDQDYYDHIVSLLPKQNQLKRQVNHNIFIESIAFI